MIFQQFNLVGRLSVLENVLTGRLGRRPAWPALLRRFPPEDYRLAEACLDRVGLAERAGQRADTLSGGERQRVAVARALAQEPRVLLADEPVASLDPMTARVVIDLLRRVCREDGLTALVSLHQVGYARALSDRIVGLAEGAVVFEGPPDRARRLGTGPDLRRRSCRRTMSSRLRSLAWPTPERWRGADSRWTPWAWGGALLVFGWAAAGSEIQPGELVRGLPFMVGFAGRMFPPNVAAVPALLGPTLETLQMALCGTVLAVVLAVPLGVLAARNLSPHPACYWAARGILNALRGINELVFALVFVSAVGLGPVPGRAGARRPHRRDARQVLRGGDGGGGPRARGGPAGDRRRPARHHSLRHRSPGDARGGGLQPLPVRGRGAVGHRARAGRGGRHRLRADERHAAVPLPGRRDDPDPHRRPWWW